MSNCIIPLSHTFESKLKIDNASCKMIMNN